MTIIASDTFTRANQSGWGTASDGETWSEVVGTGTVAISANEGTYTGVTSSSLLLLGSKTTAPCEGLVRFSMHQTTDSTALVLRSNAAGTNCYIGRQTGGNVSIAKLVAGAVTQLFSAAFTLTIDTFYWIRFRASGTFLAVRIWADGSTEPNTWNTSGTDSTYTAAGQFGLRLVLTTGSNTNKVDNFSINDTHVPIMDGYGGVFS